MKSYSPFQFPFFVYFSFRLRFVESVILTKNFNKRKLSLFVEKFWKIYEINPPYFNKYHEPSSSSGTE